MSLRIITEHYIIVMPRQQCLNGALNWAKPKQLSKMLQLLVIVIEIVKHYTEFHRYLCGLDVFSA